MSAFRRLIVASPSDVEAISRVQLRRGVLKTVFPPGPAVATTGIVQATTRGIHFNPSKPLLVQFPPEILKMILGHLEPIWLFQAEAAFPTIHQISRKANRLWYDILPTALFTEPEHFQNEDSFGPARAFPLEMNDAMPSSLPLQRYFWPATKASQNNFVQLPAVMNMSDMCNHVEWIYDVRHPHHQKHYPFIPMRAGGCRLRNLALGGPFDPNISYRRECAGFISYGKRCNLCAEALHVDSRPFIKVWDVLWCISCFKKYTLTNSDIAEIPYLDNLISGSQITLSSKRKLAYPHRYYLPFVNDVLKKHIGIDYETACAKQKYFEQILETKSMMKKTVETHRRQLRREIVDVAKKIWDANDHPTVAYPIFIARNTFAPTHVLPEFLFPARDLEESLLCVPYDDSDVWLEDPTLALKNSREAVSRDDNWKLKAAEEMISRLLVGWDAYAYRDQGCGGSVTSWVKASDQYHIRRIEETLTADNAIELLGPKVKWDSLQYNAKDRRLAVLLTKLHISPMQIPTEKEADPATGQLAKRTLDETKLPLAKEIYFRRLLLNCSVGCPKTGLLVFPRGVEGVVEHFRVAHPDKYWGLENWTLCG